MKMLNVLVLASFLSTVPAIANSGRKVIRDQVDIAVYLNHLFEGVKNGEAYTNSSINHLGFIAAGLTVEKVTIEKTEKGCWAHLKWSKTFSRSYFIKNQVSVINNYCESIDM